MNFKIALGKDLLRGILALEMNGKPADHRSTQAKTQSAPTLWVTLLFPTP
jgi:hypothetical protein